jgi:putative ABC transport system substrate-binding protein
MVAALFFLCLRASLTFASDVVIVADTRLKPVADVISTIRDELPFETEVLTPDIGNDRLNGLVNASGARVVVALGTEAATMGLSLPDNISLVYGLVIKPLQTSRENITGIYLATPVSEYTSLFARYTPFIKRLGIVFENEMTDLVTPVIAPFCTIPMAAGTPYEFIDAIASLRQKVDAFLLLPDRHLLSATATEELYRISFSEKIPVIGVSERHVKMGSLMALVFDEMRMAKQIADAVKKVLARGSASGIPVVPAERFNLFLNLHTARTMKIELPDELVGLARRTYP